MSDYIVIAHALDSRHLKPAVVMRTPNRELACAEACTRVRQTRKDAQVFDLDTNECVGAYTDEPGDSA